MQITLIAPQPDAGQALQHAGGEAANTSIAGSTFLLRTYSYKGYGLNDAFDRSVTLLLKVHGGVRRPGAGGGGGLAAWLPCVLCIADWCWMGGSGVTSQRSPASCLTC